MYGMSGPFYLFLSELGVCREEMGTECMASFHWRELCSEAQKLSWRRNAIPRYAGQIVGVMDF